MWPTFEHFHPQEKKQLSKYSAIKQTNRIKLTMLIMAARKLMRIETKTITFRAAYVSLIQQQALRSTRGRHL